MLRHAFRRHVYKESKHLMSDIYTMQDVLNAIAFSSKILSSRKEEVNRLNVFPVPDGDTGTNMSLTMESVTENLSRLTIGAEAAEVRKAITTGALMGARGNSGVITSQILRGLCEGSEHYDELDANCLEGMFDRAVEIAFQAVRKPVEGTILTVLKDSAAAAKRARKKKMETDAALELIVNEAFASVERTPDLLPVLKENNVVDAGGYGLAILFSAFASALSGKDDMSEEFKFSYGQAPKVEIEQINDWAGSTYRYCTEFLVYSETLDSEAALNFLETMGDCDLIVGQKPNFKVHVHTNTPDKILAYMLERGQVSDVHIHNMQLQSEERTAHLKAEQNETRENKAIGIVAVAAGSGNAKILESLGVDVVVSGGQTMNPSTKDLLDAVNEVAADSVIILPNNSNIILAAQSCSELSEKPCGVVPTKSVLQAFAALFGFDESMSLDENVENMTEVYQEVKTGEVTRAIKESKDAHDNPIKMGDTIGIADGSIEAVGSSTEEVVFCLLETMGAQDADTLTILAGEDVSDEDFDKLVKDIEDRYEDIEIDPHRGEQPLYPIILSLE